MAQDNNPIVRIEAEVPLELAGLLMQNTQWMFSNRMYKLLLETLTEEQLDVLEAAHAVPRPIVFKQSVGAL